jgi:hypothetical protein
MGKDLGEMPFLTNNNIENIVRMSSKHSIGIAFNSNKAPITAME